MFFSWKCIERIFKDQNKIKLSSVSACLRFVAVKNIEFKSTSARVRPW